MNKDDFIKFIVDRKINEIPNEYRNKEFILKYITEYDGFVPLWDIESLGVKVDYDIILAKCIRSIKRKNSVVFRIPSRYKKYLTEQETEKLLSIIGLLA